MDKRKLVRLISVILIILGVVLESIGFATASTEEQLIERATTTGNAEFLILLGFFLLIVSFFIKKQKITSKQ